MQWCTKLGTGVEDGFIKTITMVARQILDLATMISIPLIWLQPWYAVLNVVFVIWNFVLMSEGKEAYTLLATKMLNYLGY